MAQKKDPAPRRRAAAAPGASVPERAPDGPRRAGAPTAEEIAHRAFEIYLSRGGAPGADVDDWLQAERELTAERSGRTG
jgi:hypothetical protein